MRVTKKQLIDEALRELEEKFDYFHYEFRW